jgi:hypothetical protein
MRQDLIGNKYALGKHWTLPKRGVMIKCLTCGTEKYCFPSVIKRGGGKYCSLKCAHVAFKGRIVIMDDKWKNKISKNHFDVSGKNNPNWQGGIANEITKWHNKNWKALLRWRRSVFDRDGHKCKECGSQEGLEAHHIISLKETKSTAFETWNGVSLCQKCHGQTENYGGKNRSKEIINIDIGHLTVIAKTIPHKYHEYETVGNWKFTKEGLLVIFVSKMSDERYERLVFFHELIEAVLCKFHGIKEEDIKAFDEMYEAERLQGLHKDDEEPGWDKRAPYRKWHIFAEKIERMLAFVLQVNWKKYSHEVNSL